MNKMLIAVFDTEAAADEGLHALRKLHRNGDITLYATGVMSKGADGKIHTLSSHEHTPIGTGVGLAVGGLIGLLGGPVGVAIGAVAGTVAGAIRDFWVAGVGLDFIEDAERFLQPGKVGLIAEIEEEWVTPANDVLRAAGAQVFRRNRTEAAEGQLKHDITAFKLEISQLEAEALHASGAAKERLKEDMAAARQRLDGAVVRAKLRIDALKTEADEKADLLARQLDGVPGDVKGKIEARVKQVQRAYQARSAKLGQAWALTKEALTM